MKRKLSEEQIKGIVERVNVRKQSIGEIAQEFGVHPRSISYHIKNSLKAKGIKVNTKMGPRPILK